MEIPKKNFLIYDGDCGFCQNSINVIEKILGDKLEYIPGFKLEENFYGINKERLGHSIKFFEHIEKRSPSSSHEKILKYEFKEVHETAIIYHGAYAVLKALSYSFLLSWLLFLYKYLPGFSAVSEGVYAVIARNRHEISKLTGATACKIN